MSIWKTQAVNDAAVRVLLLHPEATTATHALIDVTIVGFGTTGGLMIWESGEWRIDRLYAAEHELPGAVGVVVVGIWGTRKKGL